MDAIVTMVASAYGRASDASKATICVAANASTVNRAASRLIKVRASRYNRSTDTTAAMSEGRRRTTS